MTRVRGDVDITVPAALVAEPGRARMLLALGDGRALPASMLASEAGVARSTASEHLRKLVDAGLVSVHRQGRHRYFRLTGPEVGELLEVLTRLAPDVEVRSLRQGTRAQALREARTCYDHLAGRLGVAVFRALIERGFVTGGDGLHHLEDATHDRLAAPGRDVAYTLTTSGRERLERLGVELPEPANDGATPLRYCVDWSEQRHHLSGAVGRALTDRLLGLGWLERAAVGRAVRVTNIGERELPRAFGAAVLDTSPISA
jgi:DNA-binding transcriptional ArsR family regulator